MDKLGQEIAEQLITELTQTVSLFPGSFKPPHKGHFEIVERASKHCDEVHVIIANNIREGYTPKLSLKIWEQYKKLLPENVKIFISKDPSPITEIYNIVKDKSNNYLVIYGKGEQDRYNSINENREKYSNVDIIDAGFIGDISATKLREAISKRNRLAIKSLIPEGIKVNDFLMNFQIHEIKVNNPTLLLPTLIISDNIVNVKINDEWIHGSLHQTEEGEMALFMKKDYKNYDELENYLKPYIHPEQIQNGILMIIPLNKYPKRFIKRENINEDKIPGGLSQGKSLIDIARHHRVSQSDVFKQLEKGIKVEMEHTTSKEVAKEIAMDHLWEDPKYYDKLSSIEEIKINNPIISPYKNKTIKFIQKYVDKYPSEENQNWVNNYLFKELKELNTIDDINKFMWKNYFHGDDEEGFEEYKKLMGNPISEIKINNPTHKRAEEVYKLRMDIIKQSKTEDGLYSYPYSVNMIDDILEKYGNIWEYQTTKKFIESLSGSELTKLYNELKPLLKINEIKVNTPGFNFDNNKNWVYIINDEKDYGKITQLLNLKGWTRNNEHITINDALSHLSPREYVVLFSLGNNSDKKYVLSSTSDKELNGFNILNPKTFKLKTQLNENDLEESKNLGDLYHFTSIESAASILKSNQLRSSYVPKKEYERDFQSFGRERGERLKQSPGEGAYYISFTRDKLLYKKTPKIAGSSIRFTVDGTKLSSTYKIIPFFYYKDELMDDNDRHRYNENEERIISNIDVNGLKDFKKYLTKTELILDVLEDNETYINRAKQLKQFYPDLITLYKEKPMSIEEYVEKIIPTIEPYRDYELDEIASNILDKMLGRKLNEVYTQENHSEILEKAIQFVCDDLEVKKPNIILIDTPDYTQEHKSFGGYVPGKQEIYAVTYNRNMADIMRSISHELKHYQQDLEGRLVPGAGKDGDEFENECNQYSGYIMRKIGKQFPEIFE
jgi:cytidyltransferase-like protein